MYVRVRVGGVCVSGVCVCACMHVFVCVSVCLCRPWVHSCVRVVRCVRAWVRRYVGAFVSMGVCAHVLRACACAHVCGCVGSSILTPIFRSSLSHHRGVHREGGGGGRAARALRVRFRQGVGVDVGPKKGGAVSCL